jgi:succinate dehydrogenase hydrophobic anchor subunit
MSFLSFGFFHWFLQRITAIFILFLSIAIFYFNLSLLNYFLFFSLSIHLKLGFENLINDYCHDHFLKTFSIMQLRLFFLYILKFFVFVL